MKRALRVVAATALASTLSFASAAQARDMDMEGARPSAFAMFGDALIVRPVMTVASGPFGVGSLPAMSAAMPTTQAPSALSLGHAHAYVTLSLSTAQ